MVDRVWALVALSGLLLPGCYSGHPDSSDPFAAGAWDGEDADDDDDDANAGDDDDDGAGDDDDDDRPSDDGSDPADDGGDPADDGGDPADDGGDPADDGGDPADDGGDPADDGGDPPDDSGDDGMDDPPPADDIPDNAYCGPVSDWDVSWSTLEQEVLVLVNEARAVGGNCGSQGSFGPSAPLTMDGALRCAGRNHSMNMANGNFFDHTAPNGETPWDRIAASGYGGYSTAAENIAAGYPSPEAVVQGWLDSDGHCKNMLNPALEEIGVGYFGGGSYGSYWTQAFATK